MSGAANKAMVGWTVPTPPESYCAIFSPEWMSMALMVAPRGLLKLSQVVADKEPLPVKRLQPVVMTAVSKVAKY
jgi:hypothetical protein